MQEEFEMIKIQFNSINNQNDHNKRGNSLFAEVDDKRQALTAELENKKEKYESLKKCLLKANHDNNQMKVIQNTLHAHWMTYFNLYIYIFMFF